MAEVPLARVRQVASLARSVASTDDVQLAQAFADQAAALENARLYAEAERRRVEAETLGGVVRTISATLDLDAILALRRLLRG
jgi:GAF domain-containing protein